MQVTRSSIPPYPAGKLDRRQGSDSDRTLFEYMLCYVTQLFHFRRRDVSKLLNREMICMKKTDKNR